MFSRLALALSAAALLPGPVMAASLGEPVLRDGLQIAPRLEAGHLDRGATGMGQGGDPLFLIADVRAGKDEPHGFAEHAFIPYLSISYVLTKDGAPTFKQQGLLYPIASKAGPHYAGAVQLTGAGTYHLTYLVSPPSAHGMMRQTDKAAGVPDWWKPISASWTFSYPLKST